MITIKLNHPFSLLHEEGGSKAALSTRKAYS